MSNNPQQAPAKRKPDCVTEVRAGNTTLIVKGYFKQDATETAADKMARAITAEAATGALRMKDAS
ncbi:MAG: transposon-encoded TnpW family protein [Oscillospiraceae bacterium]|nr:transposon-encoded TnpW family protein [Oscillospiraceae bacterium]